MCFQPFEGLEGNDKCSEVEDILLHSQHAVRPEHTTEKFAFGVSKKAKKKIQEQEKIGDM